MERRKLVFDRLDQAIAECDRLLSSGYQKTGNWSLAEMCLHIRLTIECNMHSYPWWMSLAAPVRPLLRWTLLPRLLRGQSPAGLPTAGMLVPKEAANDVTEVEAFKRCVEQFHNHDQPLYAHPGFGRLSKEQFEHFHAAHMAHHLNFLLPGDSSSQTQSQ